MILSRSLAAAALLWLAGCATLTTEAPARSAPFDLLGRVLVSHDGRAFTAGVRWQHAADADEISLLTPALQILAHIVAGAGGATLTAADQTQYHAASVEALTRRALGWGLPLAQLQFWVRGEAVPRSVAQDVARDGEGRITGLTQDGWRITFEHFPRTEHGGLPRRLQLAGPGQEIRLVIDDWRELQERP